MPDPVRFASFADVERALDGLAAAPPPPAAFPSAWPLGKALAHCAQSIECSMSGYPKLRSALFRATIGRLALRRFLSRGFMSHDVAAPLAGAPEIAPNVSFSDGAARLRAAIAKFRAHRGELQPHLAFGPLTREQYERVHAMHVADHLTPR